MIKYFFGFFLFFIVICVSGSDTQISLCSKAALKADCLKNVTGASVWIGGNGIAGNSNSTNSQWIEKSETDIDCTELMINLAFLDLSFSVTRPKDAITVYVGLYDKAGNQLFIGTKSDYLTLVDGSYIVPDSLKSVYVEMCAVLNIPLSNSASAQYARVATRDVNDQVTMGTYLPIYDGKLSFPTQYAGCNGELVISCYSDGHYYEEWYDLKSMELLPQEYVSTRVCTQINEYYNFGTDPWCINFWINQQADGTYSNPLLKFEVGSEKIVPMSGYLSDSDGNLVETAYAVAYRKMGDTVWSTQAIGVGAEILYLPSAGAYQVLFLFKKQESNPTPSDFYSGKG